MWKPHPGFCVAGWGRGHKEVDGALMGLLLTRGGAQPNGRKRGQYPLLGRTMGSATVFYGLYGLDTGSWLQTTETSLFNYKARESEASGRKRCNMVVGGGASMVKTPCHH